jgi:hypothetical protein
MNRELRKIIGNPIGEVIGVASNLREGNAESITNLLIRVIGAARS